MRTIMVLLAVAAGSILTFSAASAARKPVTKTFHVALTGEAESPAGDPVATGTATIRLRTDGRVCYEVAAKNLPRALAAHIHKGKAGVSGNVAVPLKTPNAAGNAKGCTKAAKALVRSMIKSPRAFYVNVHTAEFPSRRDPRSAQGQLDEVVRDDRQEDAERHVRAERDRHGRPPLQAGRWIGLLPVDGRERHAPDDRRAHPQGRRRHERQRGRAVDRTGRGRHVRRVHDRR